MIKGTENTFISSLSGIATAKEIAEEVAETPFEFKEGFMDVPCWKVESSFIDFIGYNPSVKILEIRFSSDPNKAYRYKGFPLEKWKELQEAKSVGKFFHSQVKKEYTYLELFPRLWALLPNDHEEEEKQSSEEDGHEKDW